MKNGCERMMEDFMQKNGFNIIMKAQTISDELLGHLNQLLKEEITAAILYIVQAELCKAWGHDKLHKKFKAEAIDEMKHAEALVERIMFFGKLPEITGIGDIPTHDSVKGIVDHNTELEDKAIKHYNEVVTLADRQKDSGTRELLERHVGDEDKHFDWLTAQQERIKRLGLENYLIDQGED